MMRPGDTPRVQHLVALISDFLKGIIHLLLPQIRGGVEMIAHVHKAAGRRKEEHWQAQKKARAGGQAPHEARAGGQAPHEGCTDQ